MNKLAIGYARGPSADCDERILPLEQQKMNIEDYARRHGYDLIGLHEDEGSASETLNRPGLIAMIAHLKAKCTCTLIVDRLDRLSRSPDDLAHLCSLFMPAGGSLRDVLSERLGPTKLVMYGVCCKIQEPT